MSIKWDLLFWWLNYDLIQLCYFRVLPCEHLLFICCLILKVICLKYKVFSMKHTLQTLILFVSVSLLLAPCLFVRCLFSLIYFTCLLFLNLKNIYVQYIFNLSSLWNITMVILYFFNLLLLTNDSLKVAKS